MVSSRIPWDTISKTEPKRWVIPDWHGNRRWGTTFIPKLQEPAMSHAYLDGRSDTSRRNYNYSSSFAHSLWSWSLIYKNKETKQQQQAIGSCIRNWFLAGKIICFIIDYNQPVFVETKPGRALAIYSWLPQISNTLCILLPTYERRELKFTLARF